MESLRRSSWQEEECLSMLGIYLLIGIGDNDVSSNVARATQKDATAVVDVFVLHTEEVPFETTSDLSKRKQKSKEIIMQVNAN